MKRTITTGPVYTYIHDHDYNIGGACNAPYTYFVILGSGYGGRRTRGGGYNIQQTRFPYSMYLPPSISTKDSEPFKCLTCEVFLKYIK